VLLLRHNPPPDPKVRGDEEVRTPGPIATDAPVATPVKMGGTTATPAPTGAPSGPTAKPGKALPKPIVVKLASDPPGATVTVDGKAAGQAPLSVEVDGREAHQVVFSLDGYAQRRATIAAGEASELSVTLTPAGPPGRVLVVSAYPVDVMWNDAPVAKGQQSPAVTLPAGSHTLKILSAKLALRMTHTVEVKPGETITVTTPALGQLNARATPDVCKVYVDGFLFGDVPILKEPIASGTHTVVFKWPDGAQDEQTVEIAPGKPGFATGEKN